MAHSQPPGFVATPATDKGRGVLVLHPWWGLNETVKGLCRRLAAEGYTAFAPDLFHGKVATTIKDAEALVRGHDGARGKSDIADSMGFMSERSNARGAGLGVIGLSFGAYYALEVSTEDPDRVRAVVVFYGTGGEDFSKAKATYLGHFAEVDEYEPASSVSGLESALRGAGRPVTFHTYPGTGHWFFEPDRTDAYNEAAARLAWSRTVAFLKKELG